MKEGDLEQRLLVTFSPKYKHYQQTIREQQIDRALKKVDKPSSLKRKRPNDPTRFIKRTMPQRMEKSLIKCIFQ
ncbi:hypothetical protein JCM21714_4617 [Gracilibacillus boraciitolerans JCM 21714]|uniref:Uncharacterized protein n=1 Tax=Gracilibacillus boraciitolerans JCM 21714 TaxID=1298598 RepID=W4VPU4_9BACI|nr:hypothetical protein [Gracilibacillus boraciitolerans]GAE95385.1 hypothetical protein JCM21714_4617 [Gracilibacillus boraciitolerans JCM 21714]